MTEMNDNIPFVKSQNLNTLFIQPHNKCMLEIVLERILFKMTIT